MSKIHLTDDQFKTLSLILFFLTPDEVQNTLIGRGIDPRQAKLAAETLRSLQTIFN